MFTSQNLGTNPNLNTSNTGMGGMTLRSGVTTNLFATSSNTPSNNLFSSNLNSRNLFTTNNPPTSNNNQIFSSQNRPNDLFSGFYSILNSIIY